jgi:hypothetical protein
MGFKPKPRFRNDGSGIILLVLFVALVVLLSRSSSPPESVPAPREVPPPSIPEPTPAPILLPAEPEPDGCPEGCEVPRPGCVILGNISYRTGERIYHAPGQRNYNDVEMDPSNGERWFCSEEEATANGWRKAKR